MSSARSASVAEGRILVRGTTETDPAALDCLVARYAPLVTHVVYRTIARREDAEDVCQEVFLRVCRGLTDFRFESKMSTWVARIAYNTCLNHLQKKREVLIHDLPGGEMGGDDAPAVGPRPDELVQRGDLGCRLEAEIRKLPPHLRTILTLFHLEEMSYREIGEVVNLPEGTVKSHLFRARRQLRQRLMSRYSEEDLRP